MVSSFTFSAPGLFRSHTNMTVEQLNEVLGDRLGRNQFGEPIFAWYFSESLLWPATRTGRMIQRDVEVPVLGTGTTETVPMYAPEYQPQKQCLHYKDQWLIAKWCAPDSLPMWQHNFPGADYPARGYRIHTNATLAPHCLPTLSDTEAFITCMNEQRSMTVSERLNHMEADRDRREAAVDREIGDEIRDLMPAFANYQPGKKGAYVSLPHTKQDR